MTKTKALPRSVEDVSFDLSQDTARRGSLYLCVPGSGIRDWRSGLLDEDSAMNH